MIRRDINYLKDKEFLNKMSKYKIIKKHIRIEVLDTNEIPIGAIEGETTGGSINVNNSSAMRRTANISLIANEGDGVDLKNVENLLAINKKIKIYIGIENYVDTNNYDKIIWFKQGVYVIVDPNITHSAQGIAISLNLKDKMCLLNGECGGGLPAAVIFDKYDQYDENNKRTVIQNPLYDIVYTLVNNYGGVPLDKIFINDLPRRIKQVCYYSGASILYYIPANKMYQFNKPSDFDTAEEGKYRVFYNGDDIGYRYVDFVYPDSKNGLVSGIGDNVCGVLNKIIEKCGNYEYFFDVDGNFIWQEKRNYLNNSYNPVTITHQNDYLIGADNYMVDYSNATPSLYTFMQGDSLVTSYSNTIGYSTIKNDFHIWGKLEQSKTAFHYHLAIREKPVKKATLNGVDYYGVHQVIFEKDAAGQLTGKVRLATEEEIRSSVAIDYYTEDWRAELYMRGLEKIAHSQIRPDRYEQELLDLFDDIYNMAEKKYKQDATGPNVIKYFIDFLEPYNQFLDYSTDHVGIKTLSYQNNSIKRMYNTPDVPDVILICEGNEAFPIHEDEKYKEGKTDGAEVLETKCNAIGQTYVHITKTLLSQIQEVTIGYSAHEVARDLLYQHTEYAESISMSAIPIYYLEPNNTITVVDQDSNISGDYVINSLNLPLGDGTMSIEAIKCLRRI